VFNPILHQPIRSKLISTLISNEELPFKVLKQQLELTDGNLSSHLKKLENEEYIIITKYFEGKRPKTMIKITAIGKYTFKEYIKQLQQFIQEN
jgi:DNA-binding MarR family transcriptional regulator